MHTSICTHTHTHTQTHKHTLSLSLILSLWLFLHTHAYMHTCIYVRARAHTHMHVCVHTHTHAHTHTHIYMYIYTCDYYDPLRKGNIMPFPQKIIVQKVWHTYLHMCYQHLPEEVIDENCLYFLRNTPGMVPLPNSIEEANEMLPAYFEFGILNGHSLIMLEQIIGQVSIEVERVFIVLSGI